MCVWNVQKVLYIFNVAQHTTVICNCVHVFLSVLLFFCRHSEHIEYSYVYFFFYILKLWRANTVKFCMYTSIWSINTMLMMISFYSFFFFCFCFFEYELNRKRTKINFFYYFFSFLHWGISRHVFFVDILMLFKNSK